jgi:hypothetical protein
MALGLFAAPAGASRWSADADIWWQVDDCVRSAHALSLAKDRAWALPWQYCCLTPPLGHEALLISATSAEVASGLTVIAAKLLGFGWPYGRHARVPGVHGTCVLVLFSGVLHTWWPI